MPLRVRYEGAESVLTKTAALEYGRRNNRGVNALPGLIATPLLQVVINPAPWKATTEWLRWRAGELDSCQGGLSRPEAQPLFAGR